MKKMITPWNEILEVEGKMTYHEASGAWNVIRLNSIFLEHFPQLKNKKANFKYRIEAHRTHDSLIEEIKKLKEQKTGVPLIVYLFEEE
ncbi:hypothetical protein KY343_02575 [Candidatus Woesearchaeota archaeon]|nr:hypothetical protein [Candidatus Woesearchaeota archaeon]